MSRSIGTITLSIGAPLALVAYVALDATEPPRPVVQKVQTVGFAELITDRPVQVAVDLEFVDGALPRNAVVTEVTAEHIALIRLPGNARGIAVLGADRSTAFVCQVSPRPDTVTRLRITGDTCSAG